MMKGYILTILGIVVAGVLIEILIPSGTISKYIKSIYAIFIVAIIIMPIVNFINNGKGFSLAFEEIELQENLMGYIFQNRVDNLERDIEIELQESGLENIDIDIKFSINNNEISYNSCHVNLKNMLITTDNLNINKYEFIKKVVNCHTNLTYQEIIINE